eukprot:COSAG02_NODE_8091_length_2714_cov_1.768260_3_plen_204_part_01
MSICDMCGCGCAATRVAIAALWVHGRKKSARLAQDWTARGVDRTAARQPPATRDPNAMPKSAAPRTQRRKYVPPATAEPKAVCIHLVRPDGKVLLLLENGVWTDPGGRIAKDESLDAAAARVLLKETGLELKQLLEIGARHIGSVYQRWSRADVQVYQVPDIPGGHQWRDVDSLVRAGKARVFRDGGALTFRLDRNLALSAMLI